MTISLNRSDRVAKGAIDVSLVGTRIKSIREAVGYSIDDLSVTCGLTGSEIGKMESGLDADLTRLKRVAAALQVPVEKLLDTKH